jgi:hypothetical protein
MSLIVSFHFRDKCFYAKVEKSTNGLIAHLIDKDLMQEFGKEINCSPDGLEQGDKEPFEEWTTLKRALCSSIEESSRFYPLVSKGSK